MAPSAGLHVTPGRSLSAAAMRFARRNMESRMACRSAAYDAPEGASAAGGLTIRPVANWPTTLEQSETEKSFVMWLRTSAGTFCTSK